jgi:hypothetical protein
MLRVVTGCLPVGAGARGAEEAAAAGPRAPASGRARRRARIWLAVWVSLTCCGGLAAVPKRQVGAGVAAEHRAHPGREVHGVPPVWGAARRHGRVAAGRVAAGVDVERGPRRRAVVGEPSPRACPSAAYYIARRRGSAPPRPWFALPHSAGFLLHCAVGLCLGCLLSYMQILITLVQQSLR